MFWSLCGFIPDAAGLVDVLIPKLLERVRRYEYKRRCSSRLRVFVISRYHW